MKKGMRLKHRLKKLSAEQEKLKTETLAKKRMPSLLACVYIEIGAVPFINLNSRQKKIKMSSPSDRHPVFGQVRGFC
jgi:hypothetical protein